jgi:hypothetical protein
MTLAEARDSLAWTRRVSVLMSGTTVNRWLGVWGGIKAFRVNEFWGAVTSASGGLGEGFFTRASLHAGIKELPISFPGERWQLCAGWKTGQSHQNPADPKVSRAQPP